MAKLTRARFLVALAAAGCSALVAGCGAGTPENTIYQGSYRSVYSIPQLNEGGTFNFTVDIKGRMTGSMVDSETAVVRAFTGEVKNDGKFEGQATNSNSSASVRGTVSLSSTGGSNGSGGADGTDSGSTDGGESGSGGGDFILNQNGTDYQGSFTLGDEPTNPIEASEFQGNYSGVYNIPGLTQGGTVSYSVDRTGKITGSVTRDSQTGLFTGTVVNSGAFTGTFAFANLTQVVEGTLVKSADNASLGNFVVRSGSQQFPGTFGATQTPPSGDSPYRGSYRGTYGMPEQAENGNISFTIDPSGKITGFFSQSNNQPVGTFTASVSNDGTFSGVVTYDSLSTAEKDAQPQYHDRPITGKIADSALGTGLAGDFVMTIGVAGGTAINRPGNFEVAIGASEPNSAFFGTYASPNISEGIYVPRLDDRQFPQLPGSIRVLYSKLTKTPDADSLTLTGAPTGEVTLSTMSIDKEGTVLGTWGGLPFNGRVTNDGRLIGTWDGYPVTGIISKQLVKELTAFQIVPPTISDTGVVTEPGRVEYTYEDKEGFAGNIVVTVEGQTYNGYIQGIGGSTAPGRARRIK